MQMARPYYVKFETPKDLVGPILEAVRIAVTSGKVRKGTNEATKAIERSQSRLLIVAEDVQPPEVVAHLPLLCDEQRASYAYVPSKHDLGKALGINSASAAAILDSGDAQHIVDQVVASIEKIKGGKTDQ